MRVIDYSPWAFLCWGAATLALLYSVVAGWVGTYEDYTTGYRVVWRLAVLATLLEIRDRLPVPPAPTKKAPPKDQLDKIRERIVLD